MVGTLSSVVTPAPESSIPVWLFIPLFVVLGGLVVWSNLKKSRQGKGLISTLSVPFCILVVIVACVAAVVQS